MRLRGRGEAAAAQLLCFAQMSYPRSIGDDPSPVLASTTRNDHDATLRMVADAYNFHEHGDSATRLLLLAAVVSAVSLLPTQRLIWPKSDCETLSSHPPTRLRACIR